MFFLNIQCLQRESYIHLKILMSNYKNNIRFQTDARFYAMVPDNPLSSLFSHHNPLNTMFQLNQILPIQKLTVLVPLPFKILSILLLLSRTTLHHLLTLTYPVSSQNTSLGDAHRVHQNY